MMRDRENVSSALPPEERQAWQEAGFTEEEALRWRAAGLLPNFAREWKALEVEPEVAARAEGLGYGPKRFRKLLRTRIPPGDLVNLLEKGLSEGDLHAWDEIPGKEVRAWVEAGFSPGQARNWKEAGFVPEEAKAWREAGFSAREAKAWKEAGLNLSEAGAWKTAGFALHEALAWRILELTPEQATSWKENAFDPTTAGSWIAQGLSDPVEARRWRDAGFSPTDALRFLRKDWPPDPRFLERTAAMDYLAIGALLFWSAATLILIRLLRPEAVGPFAALLYVAAGYPFLRGRALAHLARVWKAGHPAARLPRKYVGLTLLLFGVLPFLIAGGVSVVVNFALVYRGTS